MTFIVSFTVLIIDIHDQPASFMNTRNISNNFFFSPCCSKSGFLQFNRIASSNLTFLFSYTFVPWLCFMRQWSFHPHYQVFSRLKSFDSIPWLQARSRVKWLFTGMPSSSDSHLHFFSHASMVIHEKRGETGIRTADLRRHNPMPRPLDHDAPLSEQ